jgi:hypothetical protein
MILGGLIVFGCVAVWAGESVPLKVRLGLWEVTTTTSADTKSGFSPDALAKLTPEQRALYDEAIRQGADQGTKRRVEKQCLTREKLNDGSAFNEAGTCLRSVLNSSDTKLNVSAECVQAGVRKNFFLRLEVTDSENVKGVLQSLVAGDDRTIRLNSTVTGKWLGSSCGDVPPHPSASTNHSEHHDHHD